MFLLLLRLSLGEGELTRTRAQKGFENSHALLDGMKSFTESSESLVLALFSFHRSTSHTITSITAMSIISIK